METILISMINHKNAEMVGDLLGTGFRIIYDESEIEKDSEEPLSLIIMDLASWFHKKEEFKLMKEAQRPLFLPYLLVASSTDLKKVQDIWYSFDEVITIPISKMRLLSRVKVLLQTHQLSVQVNQLVHDKEMLIKEVHHRVKNNLMIISSLLNLQSRYIQDEESRKIFEESQNRTKSMALIHERLYASNDLKKIDFADYIHSLMRDLFNTYYTGRNQIHLNLDVNDVKVDVDNAVPLGLIINEMVTNSFKYAFPEDEDGVIGITFHKHGNEYLLEVYDDGIGIPLEIDLKNTDSLGVLLINNLTSQINGKLELERNHGTKFRIEFRDPTI